MKTLEEDLKKKFQKLWDENTQCMGCDFDGECNEPKFWDFILKALKKQRELWSKKIAEKSFDDPKYGIIVRVSDIIKEK